MFPFAHTFSIIARDPDTGEFGAAVQSHWFSTGSLVLWVEAGVGAVATQSMVEVSYGPLGLNLMRAGISAPDAMAGLLAADSQRQVRQVAMIDAMGRVNAHTGDRCIAAAGHIVGEQFSVQANMMLKDTVWGAMAEAFRGASGALAERLLAALDAAQSEGGDIRGMQSAALKIAAGTLSGAPWQGLLVDVRVEDHPQPLAELRRLVGIQSAYQLMNEGDAHLSAGNTEAALSAYRAAAQLAPSILELPFWHAVTLADLGRTAEALPIFTQVFATEPNWAELLVRLPPVGLLRDDPQMLAEILAVLPGTK
jgi:uncharacterized Ntn-hydrolase superfamily protein